MQITILAIISAIPIFVWLYVFYRIRPEKISLLILAFIAGCFSPLILLTYQKYWGNAMNLIFFELKPINFHESIGSYSANHFIQSLLVFILGVGMMEEFVKHFMIKKDKSPGLVIVAILLLFSSTILYIYKFLTAPTTLIEFGYIVAAWITFYLFVALHNRLNELKSIDQVILISIMSALGFSFIENVIYVQRAIDSYDGNMINTFAVFAVRSGFVVMIHLLCSGVFGYYYGLSMFAGPYLQKHDIEKKQNILEKGLKFILRFSKNTIFKEEKLLQGLIIAMILHGVYDFVLEINLDISHLLKLFKIESDISFPLSGFVMIGYFAIGFSYLYNLLKEKNNHIKFGLVGTNAMPEKDYIDLIKTVTEMKNTERIEEKLISEKWASPEELDEIKEKIAYIRKFDLLKKKYFNNKWINKETYDQYRKEIESIKKIN